MNGRREPRGREKGGMRVKRQQSHESSLHVYKILKERYPSERIKYNTTPKTEAREYYTVRCSIGGESFHGTGWSVEEAKRAAARQAIQESLEKEEHGDQWYENGTYGEDKRLQYSGEGRNQVMDGERGEQKHQATGNERSQMTEEAMKLRKFTEEAKELLESIPERRLDLTEFMAAYQRYFGRQCRVSSYGFNKLSQLLDAIPEAVERDREARGWGQRMVWLNDNGGATRRRKPDTVKWKVAEGMGVTRGERGEAMKKGEKNWSLTCYGCG